MTQVSEAESEGFEKGWNKGYERGHMMAEHKWRRDAEKWALLLGKLEKGGETELLQELLSLLGE